MKLDTDMLFRLYIMIILPVVTRAATSISGGATATGTVVENYADVKVFGTVAGSGGGGSNTYTYKIEKTTPTSSTVFQVDVNTGEFRANPALSGGVMFNYELISSYKVEIIAIGEDTKTATQTWAITITDVNEPPVAKTNDIVTIQETTKYTPALPYYIYTLSATDPESGSALTYAVAEYLPLTTTINMFNIDATGRVYIATGSTFDYETIRQFTVKLTATSTIGLTATTTLTIQVQNINEDAVFDNLPATVTVSASSNVITPIKYLQESDPDDPNNVQLYSYTFSSNPGEGQDKFSINSNGEVQVLNGQNLNPEVFPQYVLTIFRTDPGTPARTATGTLTINVVTGLVTLGTTTTTVAAAAAAASSGTGVTTSSDSNTLLVAVLVTAGILAFVGAIILTAVCVKNQADKPRVQNLDVDERQPQQFENPDYKRIH